MDSVRMRDMQNGAGHNMQTLTFSRRLFHIGHIIYRVFFAYIAIVCAVFILANEPDVRSYIITKVLDASTSLMYPAHVAATWMTGLGHYPVHKNPNLVNIVTNLVPPIFQEWMKLILEGLVAAITCTPVAYLFQQTWQCLISDFSSALDMVSSTSNSCIVDAIADGNQGDRADPVDESANLVTRATALISHDITKIN